MTLNNTIIRNLGGVAKAIDAFEKGIASFNASAINTLQAMKRATCNMSINQYCIV